MPQGSGEARGLPADSPLVQHHDMAKAQFGKLAENFKMIDHTRAELTELGKLGDLVEPEDVIKGAGRLVAAGASPLEIARILSDMPEQGPALAAWLQGHVASLAQLEGQMAPMMAQARHVLGVAAMRLLVGNHLAETLPGLAGGPAPQAPSGNALMQQGPAGPQPGAAAPTGGSDAGTA